MRGAKLTCVASVAAASLLLSGCSMFLNDEQQDCLSIVTSIPEISSSLSGNLEDPAVMREELTKLADTLEEKTSSFPDLITSMREAVDALPQSVAEATPEVIAKATAAKDNLVGAATAVQETCASHLPGGE